ncbi:MAG: DNA alkylation repair protein [Acidimicrobiia bacterium]
MSQNDVITLVQTRLAAAADPEKAAPMAAYLKTEMPFYGVQKAGRTPIVRELVSSYPPQTRIAYEANIRALWALPHREEKYVALSYARAFNSFVTIDSVPLYRALIVDGAWWDLVDEAATKLVGRVVLTERDEAGPIVTKWVGDEDMWLRRTSIVCQLGHKEQTDRSLLDEACGANLSDREFFIRKAIGWALREFAKTDPAWVMEWVALNENEISGLSRREALKHMA